MNAPGSEIHVNLSLAKNGLNVFESANKSDLNTVDSFIAEILAKALEITLFLNPIANSYERFGAFEAPKYASWSHQNRLPFL